MSDAPAPELPGWLDELQSAADDYAQAQSELAHAVAVATEAQRRIAVQHAPAIRAAAARVAEAHVETLEALEATPRHAFEKRRTVIVGTVQVGWRKTPGRLHCEDEAAAIAKIRAEIPSMAPLLIETKEKIRRAEARRLTDAERERIGVVVEDAADAPVIKLVGGDAQSAAATILAAAGLA